MKYKGEPTCDWTLLENPGIENDNRITIPPK